MYAAVYLYAQQAPVLSAERRVQIPPPSATVHPALALRARQSVAPAEPEELDLRQRLRSTAEIVGQREQLPSVSDSTRCQQFVPEQVGASLVLLHRCHENAECRPSIRRPHRTRP